MYPNLYNKAKKVIKKDPCMKFYDTSRPLYPETDASGVSLAAGLLQVREGMNCENDEVPDNATLHPFAFTNKSLSCAKWHYSNIEWEVVKQVWIITDCKPLLTIISKDMAMLF